MNVSCNIQWLQLSYRGYGTQPLSIVITIFQQFLMLWFWPIPKMFDRARLRLWGALGQNILRVHICGIPSCSKQYGAVSGRCLCNTTAKNWQIAQYGLLRLPLVGAFRFVTL